MTNLEQYMLIELLFKDYSKEVFPEETESLQNLKKKIDSSKILISSFSKRKVISSVLILIVGIIDYFLLSDAETLQIFTPLPYNQVVAIPAILIGAIMLIYQIFSTREFYILNYMDRLFFGEKTDIGSFQRLQFYSFKKSEINNITLGNSKINYEVSVFFVFWVAIWFYVREGIIAINNYMFLGYPLLLKIGICLILTYTLMAGVFLTWTIPVGRSQLKVSTPQEYVVMNFNELYPKDAKKIIEILNLPEILEDSPKEQRKHKRFFFIKSDKDEGVGIFNYNLLWKYFYVILGGFLAVFGFVLLILNLEVNFSLGMFLEMFVGFYGLKFLIYGIGEHFYQKKYDRVQIRDKENKKEIMTFSKKSVYGFQLGYSELVKEEKEERFLKYPFSTLELSSFKPISLFNIVLTGIIFYYVLFQSFKTLSPNLFYSEYLYYSPWLYRLFALLIILPIALMFCKSDLPSWQGNTENTMKIIKRSKYSVKKELLIRISIISVLILIPVILTIQGVVKFV